MIDSWIDEIDILARRRGAKVPFAPDRREFRKSGHGRTTRKDIEDGKCRIYVDQCKPWHCLS